MFKSSKKKRPVLGTSGASMKPGATQAAAGGRSSKKKRRRGRGQRSNESSRVQAPLGQPSADDGAERSSILESRKFLTTIAGLSVAVAFAALGISGISVRDFAEQRAALEAETTEVVVAGKDIKAGEAVSADDLQTTRVSNSTVPDGSATSISEFDGLVARRNIPAKSIVVSDDLGKAGTTTSGLASMIREGYEALELPLTGAQAMGTSLVPGDHVNLYWAGSSSSGDTSAAPVATDVNVLAVNGAYPGNPNTTSDGEEASTGTVVVEVPTDVAEKVTAGNGAVWFTLLPAEDASQEAGQNAVEPAAEPAGQADGQAAAQGQAE